MEEPKLEEPKSLSFTVADACILDVDVSDTGPCGGDAGHGGFVHIQLSGEAFAFGSNNYGDEESLFVEVCGDAERRCLIVALDRISAFLKAQGGFEDPPTVTEGDDINIGRE